jgi:hypothetical protein
LGASAFGSAFGASASTAGAGCAGAGCAGVSFVVIVVVSVFVAVVASVFVVVGFGLSFTVSITVMVLFMGPPWGRSIAAAVPPSSSQPHAPDTGREIIFVPVTISPVLASSLRRLPDLAEATTPADAAISRRIVEGLAELQLPVAAAAWVGDAVAWAVVVAGTADSAWEFFAFARGPDAVAAAAAAALALATAGDRPPLDWQGREEGRCAVFVRGERRAYAAEEAAAVLLAEPPLPRAIPGFPPLLS